MLAIHELRQLVTNFKVIAPLASLSGFLCTIAELLTRANVFASESCHRRKAACASEAHQPY